MLWAVATHGHDTRLGVISGEFAHRTPKVTPK